MSPCKWVQWDISLYIGIYSVVLGYVILYWDRSLYIRIYSFVLGYLLLHLGYTLLHWDVSLYIGIDLFELGYSPFYIEIYPLILRYISLYSDISQCKGIYPNKRNLYIPIHKDRYILILRDVSQCKGIYPNRKSYVPV